MNDPAASVERAAGDRIDGDLVERVRRGDGVAFDALVERHMRRAYAIAYRLLGQREDAEDLVQEAFIAVLERIETFERGRPFAPWLYRIVANRALNRRKAVGLRAMEEIPFSTASAGPSPEQSAMNRELREELVAAVAALPERQRAVVELFDVEGFTSPEIAEMLEIAEGTVRWHLHEARGKLRRVLAPHRREKV